MDRVTIGNIELAWDGGSRLASLQFTRETRANGSDAEALVEAMKRWIGAFPRPFALLGDGSNLRGVDADYRSIWGKFLRDHREVCFVAFFNMGPVVRVAAEMFRMGTGVRLKAFANESEARAWLREKGVHA